MSKTVKVDDLSNAILKTLTEYKDDIEEDVVETVDSITKKAKEELKQSSREKFKLHGRNEPYYKGIWNKTNYQLTHLLEFGHKTRVKSHANRDGTKRIKTKTEAVSHIRPIEEKYNVEFVDLVEERIRRRSKK